MLSTGASAWQCRTGHRAQAPVTAQRNQRNGNPCGHGHLGLTQGPVTGRLLDQMMAGQPTEIPLAPYGLARFA